MKKNKKTRFTVNIDNNLYNVAKAISQVSDKTMGEVVEMLIQKVYDEYDDETKKMIQHNDELKDKLLKPLKIKPLDFIDNEDEDDYKDFIKPVRKMIKKMDEEK